MHILQLAKEWKANCYILKLDLKRAFDSVYRCRLAKKILEWSGASFPFETKCLIRMLMSSEVVLALPWLDYEIDANIGVKQGATESPILFAKLLDCLLQEIKHEGNMPVLESLPVDGNCYMDDILTWKASIRGLQGFLDVLLPLLSYYGLQVQPTKCQLLCVQGPVNEPLMIADQKLLPLPKGEPMFVMNLPLYVDATETRLMEALIDKARKKYFGILHLLTASAPLSKRLNLLNKVVFGVLRWIVGAIFPSPAIQSMLNFFQFNCVRRMANLKRLAGELWVDAEARTLRIARALVHRLEGKRWGDAHLEAYWDFLGHRTREGVRDSASTAGILSHFRGLEWWRQQQNLLGGRRHGRHFPHLMNCERRVSHAVVGQYHPSSDHRYLLLVDHSCLPLLEHRGPFPVYGVPGSAQQCPAGEHHKDPPGAHPGSLPLHATGSCVRLCSQCKIVKPFHRQGTCRQRSVANSPPAKNPRSPPSCCRRNACGSCTSRGRPRARSGARSRCRSQPWPLLQKSGNAGNVAITTVLRVIRDTCTHKFATSASQRLLLQRTLPS